MSDPIWAALFVAWLVVGFINLVVRAEEEPNPPRAEDDDE